MRPGSRSWIVVVKPCSVLMVNSSWSAASALEEIENGW